MTFYFVKMVINQFLSKIRFICHHPRHTQGIPSIRILYKVLLMCLELLLPMFPGCTLKKRHGDLN